MSLLRIIFPGFSVSLSRFAAVALLLYTPFARIDGIGILPEESGLKERVVSVRESYRGIAVTAVLDRHLDLPSRLAHRYPGQEDRPLNPLLAVGQGRDSSNHTFVRVLDPWGLAKTQFLAYPLEVKGGVSVASGNDRNGRPFILTAPLQDDTVRELRLFSVGGLRLHAFEVPTAIQPPYHIAVGDWLPNHDGYEIAVCSQTHEPGQQSLLAIFSPGGSPLKVIRFNPPGERASVLSSNVDRDGSHGLDLYFPGRGMLLNFDPHLEDHRFREFEPRPEIERVYRNAFDPEKFIGVGSDPVQSFFQLLDNSGGVEKLDVGRHENQFWIAADKFGFTPDRDGDYIRFVKYAHLRTDAASAGYRDPMLFLSDDPADWERGAQVGVPMRRLIERYRQIERRLWEPCFTHRQFAHRFGEWMAIKDEETGFPGFLMKSRKGNPVEYGEFGNDDFFISSTYATELDPLSRLYFLPLRGILRSIAEQFRLEPERMVSLEPNHEQEIANEQILHTFENGATAIHCLFGRKPMTVASMRRWRELLNTFCGSMIVQDQEWLVELGP